MDKNTSLRSEIDVDVNYVDSDGKKGIKSVHITFVTQGIYKEYTNLIQGLLEVVRLNKRIEDITQDMGAAVANRVEVVKNDKDELTTVKKSIGVVREEIQKLQNEYDDIMARLNGLNKQTDEGKYALIQHILKKNGITDSDMINPEWWEDNTDMTEAMRFIHAVCHKDDELAMSKKKTTGNWESFHLDRLYAALCKYHKPMTWEEFMDMDIQDITNAIRFSEMPKEAVDLVWEKKHKAFEVFD